MWRWLLALGILCCALYALQIRRSRDDAPIPTRPTALKGAPAKKPDDNEPFEYKELEAQQRDMETLEPDPPAGATAQCADLTFSFAKKKEDACRDHRGISKWLADIPPHYK